jgi:poly(hydroxyalkanoate) depolymerase family esterase
MLQRSISGRHSRKADGRMKWSHNLRTLRRSIRLATRIAKTQLATPARAPRPPRASRTVTYSGFGDNPGRLKMLAHLPPAVAGRPLVVLLHGCGQDAESFAADSGWMEFADRLRFPLILPEQMEANNAARCFQWFQPSDTARDAGEAGSIAAMTRAAINRFDSDPRRIFIVGLSAGGAMAAAMLAAYPELFAAGASVAGLPVGTAQSGMQAILRMASAGPDRDPQAMAARVRSAAPAGFAGPWPRLSIWQGLADNTVAPENANLLASQWRAVHGLTDAGTEEQVADGGVLHRSWSDKTGCQVEQWSLPLMPHGYPVGTRVVRPGQFMLQAPIDATASIARFFDLD